MSKYITSQCDSGNCEHETDSWHVSRFGIFCDECKAKQRKYSFDPTATEAEQESAEVKNREWVNRLIKRIEKRLGEITPRGSNYFGRVPADWQEVAADADLPNYEEVISRIDDFDGAEPGNEDIDCAICACISLPEGYEGVAVDLANKP